MKANLIERTIEMTKSEATKAGKIGSPKANELQSYRTAYPDFTIKVKEEKKRSTYKGLDYDYMKKYIESHDNEEKTIMVEFNTLRGIVDGIESEFVDKAKFGEVKAWFLLKFPEIEEYNEKVEKLRQKIRKENTDKKTKSAA